MPSSASISVSSPPVVYPIESAKKRKRFFGKRNSKKANTGADVRDEHNRDQAGSRCGFQSKVAVFSQVLHFPDRPPWSATA